VCSAMNGIGDFFKKHKFRYPAKDLIYFSFRSRTIKYIGNS
jgi:hypothetical protein